MTPGERAALILSIALVLIGVLRLRFGRLSTPVAWVVVWWVGWLAVADGSFAGIDVPSGAAHILTMVFVVGTVAGSIAAWPPVCTADSASEARFATELQRLRWVLLAAFPVVLFFFLRAISVFRSGDLLNIRMIALGGGDEPSVVFGSPQVQALYTYAVAPLIFLSLPCGIVLYQRFGRWGVLLLGILLNTLDAVMTVGRFNFYYMLFFWVLPDMVGSNRGAAPKLSRLRSIVLVVVTVALAVGITRVRGEAGAPLRLRQMFIEYHTLGFTLLDRELIDPQSRIHASTGYGRTALGGIDGVLVLMARRIDPSITSPAALNGRYMDEFVPIGTWDDGSTILANAFYTLLFGLYFDGGTAGVLAAGLILGWLLGRYYLGMQASGSTPHLLAVMLLSYVFFFGIFQSPLEDFRIWFAGAAIFWFRRHSVTTSKSPSATLSAASRSRQ